MIHILQLDSVAQRYQSCYSEESDGYKMCQPDKREIKRTRSLFVVDLKTYQQNHQKLKMTNEILVQEVWIPEQYRVYKNKLKLHLKMVG